MQGHMLEKATENPTFGDVLYYDPNNITIPNYRKVLVKIKKLINLGYNCGGLFIKRSL